MPSPFVECTPALAFKSDGARSATRFRIGLPNPAALAGRDERPEPIANVDSPSPGNSSAFGENRYTYKARRTSGTGNDGSSTSPELEFHSPK